METVTINKQDITDLARMIEEIQDRIESLELTSNPEFMESHRRAKDQIKKREFADWDAL